jgi:hypothetical protein
VYLLFNTQPQSIIGFWNLFISIPGKLSSFLNETDIFWFCNHKPLKIMSSEEAEIKKS